MSLIGAKKKFPIIWLNTAQIKAFEKIHLIIRVVNRFIRVVWLIFEYHFVANEKNMSS